MTHSRRTLLTGIGLFGFTAAIGYAMTAKLFDSSNARLAREISKMMTGISPQEIERSLSPEGLRAIHGMMTKMTEDMPGLKFGGSLAYSGPEGKFHLGDVA